VTNYYPLDGPGSPQERLSNEFLALTATYRIKAFLKSLYDDREYHHFPERLSQEMATEMAIIGRRLKALEYQFKVKGWPVPDYEAWKHPPLPENWEQEHPKVEIEYPQPERAMPVAKNKAAKPRKLPQIKTKPARIKS